MGKGSKENFFLKEEMKWPAGIQKCAQHLHFNREMQNKPK